MGNIVGITVSASIDYLAGSLTSMLWEWIFSKYDPTQSKAMNLLQGILQLGATVTTSSLAVSLLTPSYIEKDNTIGMIGVMFFSLMYSPNMRLKLQSAHATLREILLFGPGGFMETKVTPYVKAHPEAAKTTESPP
jgi:hypothetical protein